MLQSQRRDMNSFLPMKIAIENFSTTKTNRLNKDEKK